MDCLQHLNTILGCIINDVKQIYLPISLALIALYLPIFLLSLLNLSIKNISKWILTIPIVLYLLIIPTYQPIRAISIFNTCVASVAIYYAQKVCEWILFRRNEFHQWSFFDIHHELYYYRVYGQPISVRNLNKKKKKIFFAGSIQYDQHFKSLIYISFNIIKFRLLIDLVLYLTFQIFHSHFYENYYKKYLFIRIVANQLSGCLVYVFLEFNNNIVRYILCVFLNRPLEFMPDLFRQPYGAISPADFWSRWHQM